MIAEKLKAGGFYAQPQVSIFVKEYATQGISVMGEVQHPGVYPILGARRLFDVMSLAGGTGPKAGRVVASLTGIIQRRRGMRVVKRFQRICQK